MQTRSGWVHGKVHIRVAGQLEVKQRHSTCAVYSKTVFGPALTTKHKLDNSRVDRDNRQMPHQNRSDILLL